MTPLSSTRNTNIVIIISLCVLCCCEAQFDVRVPEDPTASVGDGIELTCIADIEDIDDIDSCVWVSPDGEEYDDRGRDRDFEVI